MSEQPPQAPADKGPVTVELSEPITVAGERVTTLEIQEPKLKHYQMLDELRITINTDGATITNLGSLAKLGVEKLANLTPNEADQVSIADAIKIAGVVLGFFGISLGEIGVNPSGQ
jgi:hypothetical protein